MYPPFNRSFNPGHRHKYRRVPATFGSPAAYLEAQEINCKAELSACVRDNQRPVHLAGTVISRGVAGDASVEIITNTEDSLSRHLLRSPQRSFHIVSRSAYTPPDEHQPNGRHTLVVPHLPALFDIGQRVNFDDFGFVGDAVRQMEAIRELRQNGAAVPLLRAVADPNDVRQRGEYRAITAHGNPWGANAEQLAALCDRDPSALQVIQGPPGCGKTKLIADFLSERIPHDATALLTSTSRQAIDNAVEKVESVAPELHPVVLGNRNRFLDPESLLKKNKDKPPIIEYKWLHKYHQETQIERDPEVVAAQSELVQLKLERDSIPRQRADETLAEYLLRLNLELARKRLAMARVLPVVPDIIGMIASQAQLRSYTPAYFEQLPMRIGRATQHLDKARGLANARILTACRVFVSTVGSVHYVSPRATSKNLTTIVVDEASRLCEMDVPRLLVASPVLKNLVLVGDQQ
eukprot:SAG22_NODE_1833_length_3470_cov_3.953723_2_plen_463_part_01